MKGWVGLVGWPVADGLPTLVVTHQLQVERRTGKVRQSKTDVLPLCYALYWQCILQSAGDASVQRSTDETGKSFHRPARTAGQTSSQVRVHPRDAILARLLATALCLSVCLSVRPRASARFWLGGQCPLAAWGEENCQNLTKKWCILKYIWISVWSA